MRHQDDPNVFTPEFLLGVERRDQESPSQFEASLAGPWQVTEIAERRFAIHHAAAPMGEPPPAILTSRETALLLAALYPLIGRANPFQLAHTQSEEGFAIQTLAGGHMHTLGWLRDTHSEVLEALHLAEGFLRSPIAFAGILEAASHEALLQAGRLVLKRLAKGES